MCFALYPVVDTYKCRCVSYSKIKLFQDLNVNKTSYTMQMKTNEGCTKN